MTLAAARQLPRLRANPTLRAFLKGIGPAVVGMMLVAGLTVARSSVLDLHTGILAAACLVAMVRFRIDAAPVVVAAGVVGLVST